MSLMARTVDRCLQGCSISRWRGGDKKFNEGMTREFLLVQESGEPQSEEQRNWSNQLDFFDPA